MMVNSYKIAHYASEEPYKGSYRAFRMQLVSQLFTASERLTGVSVRHSKISLSSRVHPAAARNHDRLENIGNKAKPCVVYSYIGRKVEKPAEIRKSLLELSVNIVKTSRMDIKNGPSRP